MKKTPKMLKIEKKYRMPIERLLSEKYEKHKGIFKKIGQELGVIEETVSKWVRELNIEKAYGENASNKYLRDFDHYLRHRKEFETFSPEKYPQGIEDRALQINPEIEKYKDIYDIREIDGPDYLIKIFDYYLKHRKAGELFNEEYISKQYRNEVFRNRFDHASFFGDCGYRHEYEKNMVKRIFKIAEEKKREIKGYRTIEKVVEKDGPPIFIESFDYFMNHKKEGEIFSIDYIENASKNDPKFKRTSDKFNSLYHFILQEGHDNLSQIIWKIIDITAKDRPEILNFWHSRSKYEGPDITDFLIKYTKD